MEPTGGVSLVIATANRAADLELTLDSLRACRVPACGLEVLIADNGSGAATARVCREFKTALALRRLEIRGRGKTVALNEAVQSAGGELVVFTDDDIDFDAEWLCELWDAAVAWSDHVIFGGRVLPRWPKPPPSRLDGSRFLGLLYTRLDPGDEGGPLPGFCPFGPNMALRRSVFDQGFRFDPEIGPGSRSGVSMGDEADIGRRLEATGHEAVYVPRSRVYHRVRGEQLRLSWQLARGVRYGRMLGRFEQNRACARWFGVPRWLYREIVQGTFESAWLLTRGRRHAFDRAMRVAISVGQALQRAQGVAGG